MSNSTSLLDLISSSQAQKEVTANAMHDAASPAMLFGRRASTTSALTWGFYGGMMLVDGVLTAIANRTVALTASQTNYVEATRAGVVSKNTTAFTPGSIPLYTVVTGTATITSYTDDRAWVDPRHMTHKVSFAVTSGDVTLTAAQARARFLTTTGVLTGNRNVILPNDGEWSVYCNNTGAYTTTFKTAAGTGIVVPQGSRAILHADGTNVVAVSNPPLFADFETPTGTINSSNRDFTLAHSPSPAASLQLFLNGVLQRAGTDYTLTTNAIQYSVGATPQTGDNHYAYYRY